LRIREIDFPEPLLASQREANLVIFAGAGVSIPAPSNYPDFPGLATQVASGVLNREAHEPIDRFLGRLQDKGIKVHSFVASLLTNPQSQPNSLHFDLLKLFRSSEVLRLVTTNFDSHFTKSAANVFGPPNYEIYSAPALPLGDSFSGIVYLHGSVDKSPDRLVLTDRDFGRAYLTEGWARIFLQKLFGRYTVLFVGYSHDDTVMNYLARGLPPQAGAPQRFALTPVGNEEHWVSLGISPVLYHLGDGENNHAALPGALAAWAIQARQGALDQEQRIRTIVELPPPLDVEAADYIESSLARVDTTRFFTRYAKNVEWLRWVEEKKFLTNLFSVTSSLTDVDAELAVWVADTFVLKHPGETLSLLRRQGQLLNPMCWTAIAHRLFRKELGKRHDPIVLRRWVAVLINSWSPRARTDLLDVMLADMKDPEDVITAILLFEFLTRPVLRLDKNLWSATADATGAEDVTVEITALGDEYWLNHLWQRFFSIRLAEVADMLEPIVTSNLQRAYLLLRTQGRSDDAFDHLSSARGEIENCSQGGLHNGIDILINAAYQLLRWNNLNRPNRADALIAQWFSSESLVFKRLAIIGVAENSHWKPDQKLSWLLDENFLYAYRSKHEVFELLKNAYPGATESSQQAIVKRAKEGQVPGFDIPENIMTYERYNLLNWLQTVAPDSLITKSEFNAMQEAHPNFGKRNRPDLDVEIGTWVWQPGAESPVTVDAILEKPLANQVDWLISLKLDTPFGPSRRGLLDTVREAATRNYEWGLNLARELAVRKLWNVDLWPAIVQSWNSNSLTVTQWKEVFEFLQANQSVLPESRREIAVLLSEGTKGTTPSIPDEALNAAMNVAKLLWPLCAKDSYPSKATVDRDWLAVAINHPAGMLALFWVNFLSKSRRNASGMWAGIPAELAQLFEDVLSVDGFSADLVRVILASQLTFLFALDEEWTRRHVVPLFDWSKNENRAVRAFQGFLVWGRQTEAVLPHLLPLYVKVFAHMPALGKSRDRFCEYLAGVACFSSVNPLKNGWLKRFLLDSELPDRKIFARWIQQMLRGMQDDARKALWDNWIGEYWGERLHGIPTVLETSELGEMVEWSVFLGAAFPAAVDRIAQSPAFRLKDSFIYRELDESQIPETYPSGISELLLVLLRNETETAVLYDLDRVDAIVRRIAPLHAPIEKLLSVCDELARLGYPEATGLRKFVQGFRHH